MTNEDEINAERDDGILKIWSIRLKLAGHKKNCHYQNYSSKKKGLIIVI